MLKGFVALSSEYTTEYQRILGSYKPDACMVSGDCFCPWHMYVYVCTVRLSLTNLCIALLMHAIPCRVRNNLEFIKGVEFITINTKVNNLEQ